MKVYKPHPDLDKIDPEFRAAWARDLRTSNQGFVTLYDSSEDKYCCLGRACIVGGIDKEELVGKPWPMPEWSEKTGGVRLPVLLVAESDDDKENALGFGCLNDEVMTHPQIADLLDGKEVRVYE